MGSIVKPAHHHHEPIDSQREEINFKHLKQIENSTKMQLHLCWLRKTNNEKIVLLPHYSEKKKKIFRSRYITDFYPESISFVSVFDLDQRVERRLIQSADDSNVCAGRRCFWNTPEGLELKKSQTQEKWCGEIKKGKKKKKRKK